MEIGWKPHVEICPTCPRCGSSNTKFCYYNNYSLTQPRYFCKGCRRYWTKGGSLRNVPVGGGCRKTRRNKAVRMARHNAGAILNSRIGCCDSRGTMAETGANNNTDTNIDLAIVYANFLNQQPQTQSQPQPQVEVNGNENHIEIPDFEFSNNVMDFHLSQEICGNDLCTSTTLSDWSLDTYSKDLLYICGLESIGHHQKQNNNMKTSNGNIINDENHMIYELPPLPGHEMEVWSNSYEIMNNNVVNNHNQTLNETQLLGIELEADRNDI